MARVLAEASPRRGFLGLGIDWALVIKIVLVILERLGWLSGTATARASYTELPREARAAINREFPI